MRFVLELTEVSLREDALQKQKLQLNTAARIEDLQQSMAKFCLKYFFFTFLYLVYMYTQSPVTL